MIQISTYHDNNNDHISSVKKILATYNKKQGLGKNWYSKRKESRLSDNTTTSS